MKSPTSDATNWFRLLHSQIPIWSIVLPIIACGLLVALHELSLGPVLALISLATLLGVVFVAVYHAEVIAHRVGEPFGALVLALAVTVIEVSLIISMMLSDAGDASSLARDTVFATIMIVCNGVIGLCLLSGALKHQLLSFRVEGTAPALAVIATLATMTLILPDFTFTTEGPTFSSAQLLFAGTMSFLLYGLFLFVQTIRHRDHFLPEEQASDNDDAAQTRPPGKVFAASVILLLLSLIGVVGLAETMAPLVESAVVSFSLPHAVVGVAIALMVLLPETMAAVRTALRNQMQISFNLALGSALASIGLTIPAIAAISLYLDLPMDLGLPATEMVLLVLTLFLTAMTLTGGRATILQGAVHLVVFACFLFLSVIP